MAYQSIYSKNKLDKAMTQEQFDRIVDAIIAGKYSWACLLILESAGYNPLHYIPYRTYNRLIKDNCCGPQPTISPTKSERTSNNNNQNITLIEDLNCREIISESEEIQVQGGFAPNWHIVI